MSSTSLNCEAKSTEIITPGLDNDEFLCMKSGSENTRFLEPFLERWLRTINSFFYILWIFWQEFDFITKNYKFWINSIKIHINIAVFQGTTSGKIEFFSFFQCRKFLFCETYPFRFCLIGYHTRTHKNPLFSYKKRTFCPTIREVFIGLTTEDFVFHMTI